MCSGVKLYKGETLLELTERWRFIYDRLYDPETDLFDLSRIPDVHDNVRFEYVIFEMYQILRWFLIC